jgi:hypothetical protein
MYSVREELLCQPSGSVSRVTQLPGQPVRLAILRGCSAGL